MRFPLFFSLLVVAVTAAAATDETGNDPAAATDARAVVRAAVDHWRGLSSYSLMTMEIHRPDWNRTMSMRVWTKGDDRSLVRVTEPKKDSGNGTLTDHDEMWSFSPKVNRVIKIPSSMMSQSWMGSDFSNRDIARQDDIVDQYEHTLLDSGEDGGHTVYTIQSVPHEDAAVVWGQEVLSIRDDFIVLSHDFYDQDGDMVKSLRTLEIAQMGGRTVASRQRMTKAGAPEEWTEVRVEDVEYGLDIGDAVFTLSNLRNPRD